MRHLFFGDAAFESRDYQQRVDFLKELSELSNADYYQLLGSRLEDVVEEEKTRLRSKLGLIWRNRKKYVFLDTGETFEKDTMYLYFDPRMIKRYSLPEMESILSKLTNETV
jgi:hypothetical protein